MTSPSHGLTRLDLLLKECVNGHALNSGQPLPQTFGYLLGQSNPVMGSQSAEELLGAFDDLVDSMRTTTVAPGPAEAGMTFFGQFVDHDITLDATSAIGQEIDPRAIRNVRTPSLDLDCIYGDGPEASPHLYSPDHEGFLLFGREDNPLDLARNCKGTALIGDPRNDENILVSQVHGAFICLHNILMSMVESDATVRDTVHERAAMGMRSELWSEPLIAPVLESFEDVRRFVRLHYQYLVMRDLLPAFVDETQLKAAMKNDPFPANGPIMPVEFSVAAYRFGHATVQPSYQLKSGSGPVDLFDMQGFGRRAPDSDIEFAQFFDINGTAPRALPVGTEMAETLFQLPFIHAPLNFRGTETTIAQAQKLGLRNVLRDRGALLVASGQDVASHLGIAEQPIPGELKKVGITKTPLWFYCLQEAQGSGKLQGVGAAIVGSVFGRLLRQDAQSVYHMSSFKPWDGFGTGPFTMASLMDFVERYRDSVSHAADLRCG